MWYNKKEKKRYINKIKWKWKGRESKCMHVYNNHKYYACTIDARQFSLFKYVFISKSLVNFNFDLYKWNFLFSL